MSEFFGIVGTTLTMSRVHRIGRGPLKQLQDCLGDVYVTFSTRMSLD